MSIRSFAFLKEFDDDIAGNLLKQIRNVWTHTSTALEGNTLTLGDTHFLLEEGLTIGGKPLKDHEEVVGHARAIDLMYAMIGREITESDFFELHKAVQTEKVIDIYQPVGAWKVEPNGTMMIDAEGRQKFVEYAAPERVPELMSALIAIINDSSQQVLTTDSSPEVYAKIHMGVVHIHPFFDGNGRIARLFANLPLLNSGLPPIVIAKEDRREYIQVLANYQQKVGQLKEVAGLMQDKGLIMPFVSFCQRSYRITYKLIEDARRIQLKRKEG